MANPVLNNGIFVRDKQVEVSSHLDSYHLSQLAGEVNLMTWELLTYGQTRKR